MRWHDSRCNPLSFPAEVLLLVGVLRAACCLHPNCTCCSLLKRQFFVSAQRANTAAALCTFKHAGRYLAAKKPVAMQYWCEYLKLCLRKVPACILGCRCLAQGCLTPSVCVC